MLTSAEHTLPVSEKQLHATRVVDARGGQVWTYRLEPCNGGGSTTVTHEYDWSAVTLERLLPYLPVVDADGLAATLERLARLVEQT